MSNDYSQDHGCEEECEICKFKKEIIDDIIENILSNKITMKQGLEMVADLFLDIGYKESLISDIEEKSEILEMLCFDNDDYEE